MSVVGIDLGNLNSVIAVARNRGIDVVVNEVSNRMTPSLVGFGKKCRALGEAAKTQEISNIKGTFSHLKQLLSLNSESDLERVQKLLPIPVEKLNDGSLGFKIVSGPYAGTTISIVQLVGAYLSELKQIASAALGIPVSDCVVSVPIYYTEVCRRALLDAAEISGLKPLRIIDDLSACALLYGITKSAELPDPSTDEKPSEPRTVVFVDWGHSQLSVGVTQFNKSGMTMKSLVCDPTLGSSHVDDAVADWIIRAFITKYPRYASEEKSIRSNGKCMARIRASAERSKKILSANTKTIVSVEGIYDDLDFSSEFTRDELNGLASAILEKIIPLLQKAMSESGVGMEMIHSVELLGGSSRLFAFKAALDHFFKSSSAVSQSENVDSLQSVLSMTLNQDESVARGCAFQCAIISPVFKVREYAVSSLSSPFPVDLHVLGGETLTSIFDNKTKLPCTKYVSVDIPTASDASDVRIEVITTDFYGKSRFVGSCIVKRSDLQQYSKSLKLKVRLNPSGIFSFESVAAVQLNSPSEMEVENSEAESKKSASKSTTEIKFIASYSGLPQETLLKYSELEAQMEAADKLVADTEDRRNAVEEIIYDLRGKVEGGALSAFASESDKAKLLSLLTETEEWLYESEEATKSDYVTKHTNIKALGDPIISRCKAWTEALPKAVSALKDAANSILLQVESPSSTERFSHILPEEMKSVTDSAKQKLSWLQSSNAKNDAAPKTNLPPVSASDFTKERDDLIKFSTPILTRPKPEPPKQEVEPAVSSAETPVSDMDVDEKITEANASEQQQTNPEADKASSSMSVE